MERRMEHYYQTGPKSEKKARQGVQYPSLEGLSIRDPRNYESSA
jgi:hypothetical protein